MRLVFAADFRCSSSASKGVNGAGRPDVQDLLHAILKLHPTRVTARKSTLHDRCNAGNPAVASPIALRRFRGKLVRSPVSGPNGGLLRVRNTRWLTGMLRQERPSEEGQELAVHEEVAAKTIADEGKAFGLQTKTRCLRRRRRLAPELALCRLGVFSLGVLLPTCRNRPQQSRSTRPGGSYFRPPRVLGRQCAHFADRGRAFRAMVGADFT